MSAQVAATVIGRPRIEPELSSSSVTTVSRKSVSFSRLNDKRMHRIDDDARQPRRIEQPFLQIEFPGAILLRQQQPLQPVGEPRDDALQMRKLLVEIAAQPVELFRLAELLGADGLVEFGGEGPIVRPARLVALVPRPPRLGGGFRIAHLGVVGHFGGRRIDRLRGAVRQFVGGRLGLGRSSDRFRRVSDASPSWPLSSFWFCSSPSSPSSSSDSLERSSPMSRQSSRSCTTSPKRR